MERIPQIKNEITEKKGKEWEGAPVLDMERPHVEGIKDRGHVRAVDCVLVLREGKCHCKDAFRNAVLQIFSENNTILLISKT